MPKFEPRLDCTATAPCRKTCYSYFILIIFSLATILMIGKRVDALRRSEMDDDKLKDKLKEYQQILSKILEYLRK